MATPTSKRLPDERLGVAVMAVSAWRLAPTEPAVCPVCGANRLTIIDRSARPYAEWYVLDCAACGLDHTLHLPMAPPLHGLD